MIIKEFEEVEETEEDDKENEEGDEETEEGDEETEEDDEENEEDDEDNDEENEEDDDDEIEEEIEKIEEDDEEIEEIEEDEKKYIVKFCYKSLSCNSIKARSNKTVGLHSIRPTPPPFWVEEYQLMEYVEAFHGTRWRQRQVMGFLSEKRYMVLLKGTNEEVVFNHSDLRPLKVWEDGVWKTKELPLTQALGNKMGGSVTNGNTPSLTKEIGPPVTPSPGITAQPLNQAEAETQGKTPKRTLLPMRNQNGLENDATRENESSEDNNRKRKREQNLGSTANVGETRANDSTMVLPFEKKLPIWKTVESMEVFKTVPQSPHFSPLVETRESTREMSAVGMMYTYSALLEEVKGLQLFSPISTLESLNDSFAELEKHGFAVKEPQSRIHKLLYLKDRQAKKMEELKGAEKEIQQKILELQRKKEEADKELEEVELQFQTTVSAPW